MSLARLRIGLQRQIITRRTNLKLHQAASTELARPPNFAFTTVDRYRKINSLTVSFRKSEKQYATFSTCAWHAKGCTSTRPGNTVLLRARQEQRCMGGIGFASAGSSLRESFFYQISFVANRCAYPPARFQQNPHGHPSWCPHHGELCSILLKTVHLRSFSVGEQKKAGGNGCTNIKLVYSSYSRQITLLLQ